MTGLWTTPALLVTLVTGIALLILGLQRRYPLNQSPLVDAIDALLPQTQCAQCGYAGCRPYAEAVADGAPIDLCPPGGASTFIALKDLMGTQDTTPPRAAPVLAVINEDQCIGCTLCLPACPVDAIIGAAGQMHTIIAHACTGCELCIDPCPVDCIDLIAAPEPATPPTQPHAPPCIQCGACNPVCPVDLLPQTLFALTRDGDAQRAQHHDLARCIECGLCDRACPEEIPLAAHFKWGKWSAANVQAAQDQRDALLQRYHAHTERLHHRTQQADERRRERLAKRGRKPGTGNRDWS